MKSWIFVRLITKPRIIVRAVDYDNSRTTATPTVIILASVQLLATGEDSLSPKLFTSHSESYKSVRHSQNDGISFDETSSLLLLASSLDNFMCFSRLFTPHCKKRGVVLNPIRCSKASVASTLSLKHNFFCIVQD